MAVIERMLEEISREREPGRRPTKDDLLAFLASGDRKLNLFFIRHFPQDVVSALRRDPAVRDKLVASLRQLIISLKAPLLMPPVVRTFVNEATAWPMNEVRRHPDLWAARILAAIPLQPQFPLPLVSLRELMEAVQRQLEADLPAVAGLEELDGVYGFIERELGSTPDLGRFFARARAIAEGRLGAEDIVAYYRLLGLRIPATLARLEPSPEKDKVLVAIKEDTGVQDPVGMKLYFKKKSMARADELMKEVSNYQELMELRFFFDQIGERSNRKLFSRKTGELARKFNVRAEGYNLLGKLSMDELED
ncbi:MAG TPA: hypothetical protein VJ417_00145, partial [Candidatus Glassbacteria bacterium]|nr:hypothetical protein [Candidatus Glassbacteria bacterium]